MVKTVTLEEAVEEIIRKVRTNMIIDLENLIHENMERMNLHGATGLLYLSVVANYEEGEVGVNAPYCFSEDVKIITKDGLKGMDEVKVGDLVLCYEPKGEKLVYKRVLEVIKQEYEGDMIVFKNRGGELWVTPNHRSPILYKTKDGIWKFDVRKANDLRRLSEFKVLYGGVMKQIVEIPIWKGSSGIPKRIVKGSIEDMVALAGIYVSEGVIRGNYMVFKQKDGKEFEEFMKVLGRLDFRFDVRKGERGINIVRISSKELCRWLKENFGRYSHGKFIPRWLIHSSSEVRETFLKYYLMGDGSKSDKEWYPYECATTRSEKLMWGLLELFVRGGCGVTIRKKGNVYLVYIRKPSGHLRAWRNVNVRKYKGYVWDVNVGGGYIVVYSKGTTWITGNSGWVEFGTHGGKDRKLPPDEPIRMWVRRKLGKSGKELDKITQKIRWWIKWHGTKPHPYLRNSLDELRRRYEDGVVEVVLE